MLVTWSNGYMALRIRTSLCKSTPCLVWCPQIFSRWRYLICHVTLQDHSIEGLRGFLGVSSLSYVTALISLVTVTIVIVFFNLSHELS